MDKNFDFSWFDTVPVPLIEFDLSEVKQYISRLPMPENTNPGSYLTENPHVLKDCISKARVTRINTEALRLYGVDTRNEFERHLRHIIGENGFSTLLSGTVSILGGKSRFEEETINYRKSGEQIDVSLKFAVLPEHETFLDRVIVTVNDITKNKQLERRIDTLTLLPEVNPNIVLILQCPDRIEYVNPAGRKWLKSHHLSGLDDIHHILPKDFQHAVCNDCDRLSEQKHKIRYQDEVYDLKLKPLAGADRCMITLTDVTEMERIILERQLYFEAFQSSIHAMMISDSKGHIQYVNPKFEEIYGFSLEEARGKTPNILNPGRKRYNDLGYTDEDYDRLFRGMWESIRDPAVGYWEGEIPNRKKDGDLIWVRLIINAIFCELKEITNYLAIPIDITESRKRELDIRLDIYHTITHLAEMRDNETGNHIIRVGKLARIIAERLNMPKKFSEDIETFAPLHDIGKVGISDLILLAERKLTPLEFDTMKTHTTLGYRILQGKSTLETAAEIALNHHERYNGTGYPHGISGEDIPLSARITTVVDIYDALRSRRPYKGPWTHDEAVEEIRRSAGSVLDPAIVEAFLSMEPDIEMIAASYRD